MIRKKTAQSLLDVTMLLMRNIASHMRQRKQLLNAPHMGILAKIHEKPCSMSELAEHQFVKLPTMSRSISLLVELGMVERRTPDENRRQVMISLSDKGKEAFDLMRNDVTSHTSSLLLTLNKDELKKIEEALAILEKVLSSSKPE